MEKINLIATETSYSKDEIISIYENNSEIMGAIKYVLKNSITNQIKNIFDNSNRYSVIRMVLSTSLALISKSRCQK